MVRNDKLKCDDDVFVSYLDLLYFFCMFVIYYENCFLKFLYKDI